MCRSNHQYLGGACESGNHGIWWAGMTKYKQCLREDVPVSDSQRHTVVLYLPASTDISEVLPDFSSLMKNHWKRMLIPDSCTLQTARQAADSYVLQSPGIGDIFHCACLDPRPGPRFRHLTQ